MRRVDRSGNLPRMAQRQQLMVLYLGTPDLASAVGAWSSWDGASDAISNAGAEDDPPYQSVLAAMRDGWRVIQFPQQWPAYPGAEYETSYLRFEYVLERMVEA